MIDNTAQNQYLILWLAFFCTSISFATIDFTYGKCEGGNKSAWPLTGFIWGTVISTLVAYGFSNNWSMWPWMAVGWILMWAPGGCAGLLLAYTRRFILRSALWRDSKMLLGHGSESHAAQLTENSQLPIAHSVWLTIAAMVSVGVLSWCWHLDAGFANVHLTWGPLTNDAYDSLLKAAGNGGRLDIDFPLFKQLRATFCAAVLTWWCFALAYGNRRIRRVGQRGFVYIAMLVFAALWQLTLFQLWPIIEGFG